MPARRPPSTSLLRDRAGATAFECALIVAFIALVVSGALTVFVDG